MFGKNRNTETTAPAIVKSTNGTLNFKESLSNCSEVAWAMAQAEEPDGSRIAHHASFLTTITKGTGFQPAAIAIAATMGQRTALVAMFDISEVIITVAIMTTKKANIGEGLLPISFRTAFPRISPAPDAPRALDMERMPMLSLIHI